MGNLASKGGSIFISVMMGSVGSKWRFLSVLAEDPPTRHHRLRTDRNRHINRVLKENVHRNKDALEGGERKNKEFGQAI